MTCETARQSLSLLADGEHDNDVNPDEIAAHIRNCPGCRVFRDNLTNQRELLRFEPVEDIPDVAPAVLAAIRAEAVSPPGPRWPTWMAVAAAVAIGALAGALFVGIGREPDSPAAAEIPDRVLAAQRGTTSLQADVELIERGGQPGDPTRRFTGQVAYEAPESLAITLTGDEGERLDLVADESTWWAEGPRRCTPPSIATCDWTMTTRVVTNRQPFADAAPIPLDVIAPVESFARSAAPIDLGRQELDGHAAIGVEVTAAQSAPLLAGFDPTGALREVHPGDPVELWLEEDHLVPLAFTVRSGDSDERDRWEAARGYDDAPGTAIISVTLAHVRINERLRGDAFRAPPPGLTTTDDGFIADDNVVIPSPTDLPAGLSPYRSGRVRPANGAEVALRSWTDGRAWVVLRVTRDWAGGRLFGNVGDHVRRVDLGDAGIAYVGEGGTRIALHANGIDIALTGSLSTTDLLRVVGSLGARGLPVPDDWAEAATATLDDAESAGVGLVPGDLQGFGPPTVRIYGETITIASAGPGDRAFTLASTPGGSLPPPLDPHVIGVRVRDTTGRFSPERGDLEWLERGRVYSLRTATLALGEMIAIADALERP